MNAPVSCPGCESPARLDTESYTDALRFGETIARWVCVRYPARPGHEKWLQFRVPEAITIPARHYIKVHPAGVICACGCGGSLEGKSILMLNLNGHRKGSTRQKRPGSCHACSIAKWPPCYVHGGMSLKERMQKRDQERKKHKNKPKKVSNRFDFVFGSPREAAPQPAKPCRYCAESLDGVCSRHGGLSTLERHRGHNRAWRQRQKERA